MIICNKPRHLKQRPAILSYSEQLQARLNSNVNFQHFRYDPSAIVSTH